MHPRLKTAAVAGDLCAFGGCDAFVYVVHIGNGTLVTKLDTGAYVASSVTLDQGRVYAGNYDGLFLCGDIADANQVWKYSIKRGEIFASGAVTADRCVFGDRAKQVVCLSRDRGQRLWAFTALGNVDSSPVIVDQKVVVGADDGRLYLLSLTDGKKLWSYDLGKPIVSSPAVAHGRVVVGCDDGTVYAFGKVGQK